MERIGKETAVGRTGRSFGGANSWRRLSMRSIRVWKKSTQCFSASEIHQRNSSSLNFHWRGNTHHSLEKYALPEVRSQGSQRYNNEKSVEWSIIFLSNFRSTDDQMIETSRASRPGHYTKCSGKSTRLLPLVVKSQLASSSQAQQFFYPGNHGVHSSVWEKNGKYCNEKSPRWVSPVMPSTLLKGEWSYFLFNKSGCSELH